MSEILAAILGALLGGGSQAISAICERRRRTESVLTAIASEVDSLCRLIRHQGYLEFIGKISDDIEQNKWDGTVYIVDIRSNYFVVFEGLVGDLGYIEPSKAAKIVKFYAYCKAVIDSTRPDGPHSIEPSSIESGLNMVSVAAMLRAVLTLGDEIIQFPKVSFEMNNASSAAGVAT